MARQGWGIKFAPVEEMIQWTAGVIRIASPNVHLRYAPKADAHRADRATVQARDAGERRSQPAGHRSGAQCSRHPHPARGRRVAGRSVAQLFARLVG